MMLAFFLSCATLSPYLAAPAQNPHPSCAPSTHYQGIGKGETPQESISDAHRQISEQISSSIQAERELIKTYTELQVSRGKELKSSSESSSKLRSLILTETHFEHNDLIRDVIAPISYKGTYHTLSCLNKKEATEVILEDLAPALGQLNNICAAAQNHASAGDLEAFATSYQQINPLVGKVIPELYVVRSLNKEASNTEKELRGQLELIENHAAQLRASLSLGLFFDETDLKEADQQQILDALRHSMESLGLNTLDGAEGCGEALSHQVRLSAFSSCEKGPVGHLCQPTLKLTITSCQSNNKSSIGIANKHFSGQDYHSANRALQKALSKADAALFIEDLHRGLASIVPLPSL